jgi:hypothetical protein
MKKLLSLAIAGAALAALSQPMYAKSKEEKGKGQRATATARGEVQGRAVQQPSRMMQQPARTATNFERRDTGVRSQAVTRARVEPSGRTITRSEPSVAFGGQTRAERRERTVTTDRTEFRRDRDWDRGEFRFRRPPITTYRNWDRDRIYTWDNHRWHWYGGSWVIVGALPGYSYYDEPIATTYVASSGSLVARVQRELARDGYDPGPIDGVMGGQTRAAIFAFQRNNNLPVTGRIDSALLDELNLE